MSCDCVFGDACSHCDDMACDASFIHTQQGIALYWWQMHQSASGYNLRYMIPWQSTIRIVAYTFHIYFAIFISYTFTLQSLTVIEIMFVWDLSLRRVDDTRNVHVTIRRNICVIEPMSMCRYFELWIGLWSRHLTRLTCVFCVISGVLLFLNTHNMSFVWSSRFCVEINGGWNLGGNCCGNVYDMIYDNVFCNCCANFSFYLLELFRDEHMWVAITISNCRAWLE